MKRKALILSLSGLLILSSCSESHYGYISRYREKKSEQKEERQTASGQENITNKDPDLAEETAVLAEESSVITAAEAMPEATAANLPAENKATDKKNRKKFKLVDELRKSPAIKALKPQFKPEKRAAAMDDDGNCCAFIIAILLLYVLVYIIFKVLLDITIPFWIFLVGLLALSLLLGIIRYIRD